MRLLTPTFSKTFERWFWTVYSEIERAREIWRVEDEAFYVLGGEIEFNVEGNTGTAGPGYFVNTPKGTLHTFRNAGRREGRGYGTPSRSHLPPTITPSPVSNARDSAPFPR